VAGYLAAQAVNANRLNDIAEALLAAVVEAKGELWRICSKSAALTSMASGSAAC
jgi:hypothetical protein